TGGSVQSPAFFALAAVGLRRAIQVLAFADIEAGEMAAPGQRGPHDAIGVDVDAAWIEPRFRNLEYLGLAARWRVGAPLQADQEARIALADAPHTIVHGTWNNRIHAVA